MNTDWAKLRLGLNIYIAVALTVLGVLFVPTLGSNEAQNRRLAEQANQLAALNRRTLLTSCQRANFTRQKVNAVAGALVGLLNKSVEESEHRGRVLTPAQREVLDKAYEKLRPLHIIPCYRRE